MRPRAELGLALALGAIAAAGLAVHAFTTPGARALDRRRSTYLTGPTGARAWVDALDRLGVATERWRRPVEALPVRYPPHQIPLFAALEPAVPLTFLEALQLERWSRQTGDLLLAGPGTDAAMRCFGWKVTPVEVRGAAADLKAAGRVGGVTVSLTQVHAVLTPTHPDTTDGPSSSADLGVLRCRSPKPLGVDTLLRTPSGQPVALQVRVDSATRITLVADGLLFANEALRRSDAGEFSLALVVPRYRTVLVDEYHQGYGSDGGLTGAVLAWSVGSPWGWGAWQLVAVGLLALLAAAVRFGPVLPSKEPERRSPMEHVHALATSLGAARGHDVAARLMVQGLRRRLAGEHRPQRRSVEGWLAQLADRVRSPRARAAVKELQSLIDPPQPADAVLRAAYAVEDVWQELKP
ncbi:MAG TPA: DUF4350 domain-containing protein [Gemmatimonadales bacterium]|nr:DUF4350 domain-containing protein [Gemmatimonadales bacterium]